LTLAPIVLSATGVKEQLTLVPIGAVGAAAKIMQKRLKILNHKECLFNNIRIAAMFGTFHVIHKCITLL
jgi:hypothetical protein